VCIVRRFACVTPLIILLQGASISDAAPIGDCAKEAKALGKDQSELPKLDVASPRDRPPYCITLETIMAFAGRVKAHVAHCPTSDFATAAAEWAKTQTDYSKLFSRHRCKRTM
jgi:hypothetical protein